MADGPASNRYPRIVHGAAAKPIRRAVLRPPPTPVYLDGLRSAADISLGS